MDLIYLSILGALCMLLVEVSDLPSRERAWHYATAFVRRS
jgi:hypothetical protein